MCYIKGINKKFMKYYAVKEGRKKGIFTDYNLCKESVSGYKNAVYKSFLTYEEALNFLNDNIVFNNVDINKYIAYVDGSYNSNTQEYSFGCVLIYKDKIKKFYKKYDKDDYSVYRNVAGEVKGASFIINYCIKQGIKELDLYYDYEGIRSWYLDLYKANNLLTKAYKEFALYAKDKINVNFIKVKSHSNNYYNDMVDKLAKEALNI